MKIAVRLAAVGFLSLGGLSIPAFGAEEHGHCSGPNVCQGDAACLKQGYKELTKEQCTKIEGAKFEVSTHAGEAHKDDKHDHKKK